MIELKGKYNTTKMFSDNAEPTTKTIPLIQ